MEATLEPTRTVNKLSKMAKNTSELIRFATRSKCQRGCGNFYQGTLIEGEGSVQLTSSLRQLVL
jgi:hypothetical protein